MGMAVSLPPCCCPPGARCLYKVGVYLGTVDVVVRHLGATRGSLDPDAFEPNNQPGRGEQCKNTISPEEQPD